MLQPRKVWRLRQAPGLAGLSHNDASAEIPSLTPFKLSYYNHLDNFYGKGL
jgi:hypothetical protein